MPAKTAFRSATRTAASAATGTATSARARIITRNVELSSLLGCPPSELYDELYGDDLTSEPESADAPDTDSDDSQLLSGSDETDDGGEREAEAHDAELIRENFLSETPASDESSGAFIRLKDWHVFEIVEVDARWRCVYRCPSWLQSAQAFGKAEAVDELVAMLRRIANCLNAVMPNFVKSPTAGHCVADWTKLRSAYALKGRPVTAEHYKPWEQLGWSELVFADALGESEETRKPRMSFLAKHLLLVWPHCSIPFKALLASQDWEKECQAALLPTK